MDATSAYDKIIAQCKSNDVDTRVDALSKLQAHFSKAVVEVTDPEALVNILKPSLRTSNLHLTNAALSALPVILPSLITRPTHAAQITSNASLVASSTTSSVSSGTFDVQALRSALNAFLPTGGVIDRLGDKEKSQSKARDALVLLGGYAFRAGGGGTMSTKLGKGQETPLTFFERVFKEGGLGSKVWKVREQAILTLVHIRRAHHLFPIRPYLSYLIDCLEDTDAHVRDCARQSVVELFTGPAVSDAARADLKKEMSKKGVRKAIVDDVLAKLLSKVSVGSNPRSHEGSEDGEATVDRDYVPPSLALQRKRPRVLSQVSAAPPVTTGQPTTKEIPRPASRAASSPPPLITPSAENVDVLTVYIASSRDLENEFAAMQKPFEGKETEHNWAAREHAIQLVRGMLKGDVHDRYSEHFMNSLKDGFIQWSLKTLASLRTTVAVNTCLLYAELAVALGPQLDPLCDILFTNLLRMSGFTKKITAQQSQSSITTIISHTSPQPRLIVPLLWATLQEKNTQCRTFAVSHFKYYLDTHGQRSRHAIEISGSLDTVEKAVKKALADPNPGVRELARTLFWVFANVWKERGTAISNALDPNARKQLEKVCPSPDMHVPLPSTPGGSKKSSVAAAIAASRAKAKVMATAPPVLRHRATSGPRLERLPNESPKSVTAPRSRSPLRASTSPPSPTLARFASGGFPRSTSACIVPSALHTRTLSRSSDTNGRATSPSSSDGAHRRISPSLVSATNIRSITNILADSQPSTNQASQIIQGPLGNQIGAAPIPSGTHLLSTDDESLLMAQSVPVPEDSDSEDDAINVLSFSAAMQQISPQKNSPNSPASTLSPASDSRPSASVSNALSTVSVLDIDSTRRPIVEDALRARAEQAESAAERLLELVEPEDDLTNHPTLPPSLLKMANEAKVITTRPKPKPAPLQTVAPQTPDNRTNMILKKAALFTDSPMMHHSKQASLLDVLRSSRQETGWWLKRKALSSQASPLKAPPFSESIRDLQDITAALESTIADVAALKRLAIICMENPILGGSSELHLSSSPSPISKRSQTISHAELWETNQSFEKLFKALVTYLQPSKTEDELAYGLIVIWEALENQSVYLDGRESELFSTILRVRYCNKITVLEGTNAIRDTLTSKLDPVYGLTTLHANLKVFYSGSPPSPEEEEVKAATYAFGMVALGKFILRLPAEIAEEELPRLKGTLTTSLNDRSSLIVRESAAAAITAAQLVLRDETHLFTLLDGLTDEKKNLLTYLFDKHGARNLPTTNGSSGMEKLERELRRLDNRTSTPLRSSN